MPYEIKLEDDGAKIFSRFFGILTSEDMYASYEERYTDPEKIKKYKVFIADYTDVTDVQWDDLDVERLAGIFRKASSLNPDVIGVGIMPTDLLYGMGRMWEGYIFDNPWKVKIVRTWEEAQAFLDINC